MVAGASSVRRSSSLTVEWCKPTNLAISLLCEQIGVSASGFHQWKQRNASKEPSKAGRRTMSNDALLAHIKAIHVQVKGE